MTLIEKQQHLNLEVKVKFLTIHLFNYTMLADLKIWIGLVNSSYLYFISGTTTSAAVTEEQHNMENSILGRKQDPLLWWNKHQHSYQHCQN
jgi:hypothetical protein